MNSGPHLPLRASDSPSLDTSSGLAFVKRHGASFSSEYREVAHLLQYKNATELIELFSFVGDEKILDVGTGEGSLASIQLRARVPSGTIIGIDHSSPMIEAALASYEAKTLPASMRKDSLSSGLYFHPASAEAKFPDSLMGSFDLTTSFFAYHWMFINGVADKALENQMLALKSGGAALLTFSLEGTFDGLFECAAEVGQRAEWSPYFEKDETHPKLPDFEQVRKALQTAGFALEKEDAPSSAHINRIGCRQVDTYRNMGPPESFARWIRVCIRPIMENLSELEVEKQQTFAEEVVDEYSKRFLDRRSSNDILLPDRTIRVFGVKP